MATSVLSSKESYKEGTGALRKPLVSSVRFDLLMGVLGMWLIIGLFLDGWAHAHKLVDTFFTPWHGFLYTGFAINAIVLSITLYRNHARGYAWKQALPGAYMISLLGAPLFAVAGVGDLVWHTLFGFEVGIEPLLSPTHLVLAFSGVILTSGPIRAAWKRVQPELNAGWANLLPMLLSMIVMYSAFTFFTQFAHPYTQTWAITSAHTNDEKSLGAASVLLGATLMIGMVLLLVRRWQLPAGSLTLLLSANAILMSILEDHYMLIPQAIVVGIIADALLIWLKPSSNKPGDVRIFAFLLPTLWSFGYFLTLMLTAGTTWTIHLWLGTTIMSGIIGVLVSYLLVPPRIASEV